MTTGELKLIFVCFFFGGGMLYRSIKTRKITREIADMPRSKVSSAPQGFVELEGFAWPAGAPRLNMEGDEIVYYKLEIQRAERRGGKDSRTHWVTVFTHLHAPKFFVVDATGLALIDPATCELDLRSPSTRGWGRLKDEEKVAIRELCKLEMIRGFPPANGFFGIFSGEFRVVEHEIEVGTPIYAKGDFRTSNTDPKRASAAGLTEFYARIFNPESRGLKNIKAFLDKNKDGKVSEIEAHDGYGFAARQSRFKAKDGTITETEFEVFGSLGSSQEHPLFLADAHQAYLVARRERFVWLQFVAGALLLALGIAMLVPGGVDLSDYLNRHSSRHSR